MSYLYVGISVCFLEISRVVFFCSSFILVWFCLFLSMADRKQVYSEGEGAGAYSVSFYHCSYLCADILWVPL